MYRFLLRPKWIALHLLSAVAIIGMVGLGFWQLRRLDTRTSFNDRVAQNTEAPIVDLYDIVPRATSNTSDLDDLAYRTVQLSGTYVADPQFIVVNVSQGGTGGRNVVNALRLEDDSLVIVNRGFVPSGLPLPETPSGTVSVLGRVKVSQEATLGQTTDDGSERLTEIRRVDLNVLSGQFDAPVAPMYVELLSATPAEPDQVQVIAAPQLGSGPHLSYAMQWFFFSLCVVAGWVIAVRRQLHERRGTPRKRRGPPPIATADDLRLSE